MSRPKNIVVRGPNWIGDHVMAESFYAGLRAMYPDARITLVIAEAAAPLYGAEYFDEILPLTVAERKLGKRYREVARWLKARHFDLAISLPASFSSAFLFFWGRIPHRVGFAEDLAGAFLTTPVPWKGRAAGVHKSELYTQLLETLNAGHAARVTARVTPPLSPKKLVVIAPGAANPLREWPHFADLFESLPVQFPEHRFVVVGGPGDTKWKAILHRFNADGRLEDWIGRTTLEELADLVAQAELVIANDSGVAHFAATRVGVPVLVLFGPGDPDYVRPLGRRVKVVREAIGCSPCESAHCRAPFGYQACLKGLRLGTVTDAVHEMVSL